MSFSCQFCSKEIGNSYNHQKHEQTCKLNPNRVTIKVEHPKKQCPTCQKEISYANYERHIAVCKGLIQKIVKDEYLQEDGSFKCPECDFSGSKKQLTMHIWLHNGDSRTRNDWISPFVELNRKRKNGEAPIWNKGLTVKANPELADKLSAGGRKTSQLAKDGVIDLSSFWKMWTTPEKRKEKSDWRIRLHQEHPETHPNRRVAHNRSKMTYPERAVYDYLTEKGIKFEHNLKINKYFPDFTIGDIIIEVDGKRWHDPEKDQKRDAVIATYGYTVYRFTTGKDLLVRIEAFLKSKNIL
jgi:very-short-patch-repair endonuclease